MQATQSKRRRTQAGQNMIEFALVFLIFLSFFVAMFNFGWALFVKATLHQAVMAGVRYAITGPDGGAAGQDAAIKDVVKKYTIGLINDSNDSAIKIEYFRPNCNEPVFADCITPLNTARNIVAVRIEDYQLPVIAPQLMSLMSGTNFRFSVVAMDKVEPFPGGAPNRNPIVP